MTRFALAVLALLPQSVVQAAKEVCVKGFVMDKFCIERGALIDPDGLWPLSNADLHTVHCLIDVDVCRESGYEILTEPVDAQGNYTRAVELDDAGNDLMVEHGKLVGVCNTCAGLGWTEAGLRATVKGEIDTYHKGPIPRLIVSEVLSDSEECPEGTEFTPRAEPEPEPMVSTESEYCVTGFVMDKFCIDRGALIDPDGLPPLSNADVHTIHCLIDVDSCRNSGYEILTPPADEFGNLTRRVELDDVGNDLIIEYGKDVGDCNLCTGLGTQQAGLRVTVKGTIDPDHDGQIPRLLVSELLSDTEECPEQTPLPTPPPVTPVPKTPAPSIAPVAPVPTQNPESVDCTEFQTTLELSGTMTMKYVLTLDEGDSSNGYIFVEMACECEAWVAFAVSPDGTMPNSDAVIGLPNSNDVFKYTLGARSLSAISPRPDEEQTLLNTSIEYNGTHTVMQFVKRLIEPNELEITASETNNFLWASGSDNTLGQHPFQSRGSVPLELSACEGQGSLPPPTAAPQRIDYCVTGYVMDKFCIDRGALLDPNGLPPLSNADVHTVHCLIDVDSCRMSGYEILTPPADEFGNLTRHVELDEEGNALLIAYGKDVGVCNNCVGEGTQEAGLRVTVKGEIDQSHTGPIPRLLVEEVLPDTVECPEDQTPLPTPPPTEPVVSPTTSPTGPAAPSPTQDPQSVDCAEFQATVQLDPRMTMSYVVTLDEDDETNGQIAVRLECECQAWVGFAASEDQSMPNSDAIIGLPLDNEVAKFRIGGVRFVSEADDRRAQAEQTLSNATIIANDTHTILQFVKRLVEPNEIPIDGSGPNNFLWAFGTSFSFGAHLSTDRGVFSLSLSPCIQGQGVLGGTEGVTTIESETFQTQWSAHGLFASTAWGILAPCAVGSSILRDYIPGQGIWFKIHQTLNSTVLIFTIIAFSLAVNALNRAGGEPQHFQVVTHRTVGLVIFILVIIQVFGGLFRPHAPHKGEDGVVEEKKPVRFAWEILHKGSGYGLLALSWWEVQEGIRLYYMRFGGTDFRPLFWGITGTIVGVVLLLSIYRRVSGSFKE